MTMVTLIQLASVGCVPRTILLSHRGRVEKGAWDAPYHKLFQLDSS